MSIEKKKIFIGPDEGEYLPGLDIVHKVTAEVSGGSLKIEEWGLPPGEMIPPHTHTREDEYSFVLEGELTCYVGAEILVAPAGSYVVKPRGMLHAFYNAGAETVRVMEILTPGGSFEGYFDEYEEIASSEMDEEQHRRARAELGERYVITWHDERIPEVESRFGIGGKEKRDERSTDTRPRPGNSKEVARMSAQENEVAVRRYIEECWNRHNIDATDELVSPEYLNHAASAEYQRAGVKYSLNWLFAVFPDHRFDIEDAVAEGDTVAVRGTCSGTHEGELWDIPPTGERFAVQQVHWFRVADGKVAEHWAVRDDLGMMRQLGVMPTQDKEERDE